MGFGVGVVADFVTGFEDFGALVFAMPGGGEAGGGLVECAARFGVFFYFGEFALEFTLWLRAEFTGEKLALRDFGEE